MAVTNLGGESAHVALNQLRADADVVKFFQRTLMKPMWPDESFVVFFQSRPGEWEYNAQARAVKLRSKLADQIQEMALKKQKTAPFPAALYEALLRAGTLQETVSAVYGASSPDMGSLPIDTVEALLDSLGKTLEPTDPLAGQLLPVFVQSQVEVLGACPGALNKKGAGLGMLMDFYKKVIKFGGDAVDPRVAQQRIDTLREICEAADRAIR